MLPYYFPKPSSIPSSVEEVHEEESRVGISVTPADSGRRSGRSSSTTCTSMHYFARVPPTLSTRTEGNGKGKGKQPKSVFEAFGAEKKDPVYLKYGWEDHQAAEMEQNNGATIMFGNKIEGIRRPGTPGEETLPALQAALEKEGKQLLCKEYCIFGFGDFRSEALSYFKTHPRRKEYISLIRNKGTPLSWKPPQSIIHCISMDEEKFFVTWLLIWRIELIEEHLHDLSIPLSVRFLLAACQRSCAPLAIVLEEREKLGLSLEDEHLEKDGVLLQASPDPNEAFHAGALPDLCHLLPHCGLFGDPVSTPLKGNSHCYSSKKGSSKLSAASGNEESNASLSPADTEEQKQKEKEEAKKALDVNSPEFVRNQLLDLFNFMWNWTDGEEEKDDDEEEKEGPKRKKAKGSSSSCSEEQEDENEEEEEEEDDDDGNDSDLEGGRKHTQNRERLLRKLKHLQTPFTQELRKKLEHARYQQQLSVDELYDFFSEVEKTLQLHRTTYPEILDDGTECHTGKNPNLWKHGMKKKTQAPIFGGQHPFIRLFDKIGPNNCKLRALGSACRAACNADESVFQTLTYMIYATLAGCYPTDPDHPNFELTKALYKSFFTMPIKKNDFIFWIYNYPYGPRTEGMPGPPTDQDLLRITGVKKLSDLPMRLRPRKRRKQDKAPPTGHEKLILCALKQYLIYAVSMSGDWLENPLKERRRWSAMQVFSSAASSAARRLMQYNLKQIDNLRQKFETLKDQPEQLQNFIENEAVHSPTLMTGVEDVVTEAYHSCCGIQKRSVKKSFERAIIDEMNILESTLYARGWDVENTLLKFPDRLINKETGENAIEDLKACIRRFDPCDKPPPEMLIVSSVRPETVLRLRYANNAYDAGTSSKSEAKAVVNELHPSEYAIVRSFYESVALHTSIKMYDLPYHTTLAQLAALHLKYDIPIDEPLPSGVGCILLCTNCLPKGRRLKCKLSEGKSGDMHNFGHQEVVVCPETLKLSCLAINERTAGKKKKSVHDIADNFYSKYGATQKKIESTRRKEYRDHRKRKIQEKCAEGHIKQINIIGRVLELSGQQILLCPSCANPMRYHPARYGPKGLSCPNCGVHGGKVIMECCVYCKEVRKETDGPWHSVLVYYDRAVLESENGIRKVYFCDKHKRDWFIHAKDRPSLKYIFKGIEENWGSRRLENGDVIPTQPQPARQRYTIKKQPTRKSRFQNRS